MQELISVIMPAYNTEKYVSEAVESVINQTYTNWELLAIDDGSTDNTGNILDNYAKTDSRIKVFHQKNKGVSAARNVGLDNAKGVWIVFLDSDDTYTTDAFEILYNEKEDYDLVIANYKNVGNVIKRNGMDNRTYRCLEDIKKEKLSDLFRNRFLLSTWACLWKKDCLHAPYRQDCYVNGDAIFFTENMHYISKAKTISKVVYNYKENIPTSLSHNGLKHTPHIRAIYCRALDSLFENYNSSFPSYTHFDFEINFISYIKCLVNSEKLSKEEKYRLIEESLKEEYINAIPLYTPSKYPSIAHLWIVILTRDVGLIYEAFQEYLEKEFKN